MSEDTQEIEGFYGILYTFDRSEGVEFFCSHMNYSKRKTKNMKTSKHWFYLQDTGFGDYAHVAEECGGVRFERSFKYKDQFTELSISNGKRLMCKSMYTVDGNKLIYVQKGKKEITIVREFFLTHMIMTIECEKVFCRKFFKAQNRGTVTVGF